MYLDFDPDPLGDFTGIQVDLFKFISSTGARFSLLRIVWVRIGARSRLAVAGPGAGRISATRLGLRFMALVCFLAAVVDLFPETRSSISGRATAPTEQVTGVLPPPPPDAAPDAVASSQPQVEPLSDDRACAQLDPRFQELRPPQPANLVLPPACPVQAGDSGDVIQSALDDTGQAWLFYVRSSTGARTLTNGWFHRALLPDGQDLTWESGDIDPPDFEAVFTSRL